MSENISMEYVSWDSEGKEKEDFAEKVNARIEELELEGLSIKDIKFSEYAFWRTGESKESQDVWGYSAYILVQ